MTTTKNVDEMKNGKYLQLKDDYTFDI